MKAIWLAPSKEQAYKTSRGTDSGVRTTLSEGNWLPRRGDGGLVSFLQFSAAGCKKDILHQHAGTAEPRDPPPHQRGGDLSKPSRFSTEQKEAWSRSRLHLERKIDIKRSI